MSAPDDIGTEDQLLKEAATWFARMRGPDAEAHRGAFEAWLRLGALHRQAYNRASEIFAMGKLLGGRTDTPAAEGSRNGWAQPRRLFPIAALLVIAAMAWFALGGANPDMRDGAPVADGRGPDATFRLATTAGETRATRLADGSLIDLQARTRIEVRFATDRRDIWLEEGSARFTVAHERRPLVVHAGGGQIRAVGTLFEVAIGADRRVTVRLLEGTIDVTPATDSGTPRPASRRLRAGQSTFYPAGSGAAPAPAAPSRPAAPTAGPEAGTVRDFENVPLSELLALANRGARRPLRLADPRVGTLRVSGRFRIDDTSLLAERLGALFDLTRTRDGEGAILLGRR